MQHVQLVRRHRVEELEDELRRLVMARRIEQQPAPGEARRVVDGEGGDRHRLARLRERDELPERDAAVEKPRARRRGHLDPSRRHLEAVAFRARRRRRIAPQVDLAVARLARGHREPQTARLAKELGECRGGAARLGVAADRDDRGRAPEREFSGGTRDLRGIGNHRRLVLGDCARGRHDQQGKEGGAESPRPQEGPHPWEHTAGRFRPRT